MRRAASALVSLFALIPAVGCGTMSNQHALGLFTYGREKREQRVYGGVRSDGEMIGDVFVKVAHSETEPTALIWIVPPCVTLFYLADMPLSLVADTVMLPWDIRAQWLRLKSEWQKPKEVQPSAADVTKSLKSLENNPFNSWQVTRNFEVPPPTPKTQPDSQR